MREPIGFQVEVVVRKGPAARTQKTGPRFTVRSAAEQLADLLKREGREAFVTEVYE